MGLWAVIAADASAGMYLLAWALRRERRDKPAVLAVGVLLLLCAPSLLLLGARHDTGPSRRSHRPHHRRPMVRPGRRSRRERQRSPAGGGRAPLIANRLPDGTPFVGQLGVLAIDDVADRVQCALCGRWLRSLGGSPLQAGHGWTTEQYRAAFGLTLHRSLDCPSHNSQRAALHRDRIVSNPQIREAIAAGGQRGRQRRVAARGPAGRRRARRDIYQRPERQRLQRSHAQHGGAIRAERAAAARQNAARRLGFSDVRDYLLVRASPTQLSASQMASKLGCARETIAALLAEHGIARPA